MTPATIGSELIAPVSDTDIAAARVGRAPARPSVTALRSGAPSQSQQESRHPHVVHLKWACSGTSDEPQCGHSANTACGDDWQWSAGGIGAG